MPSPDVVTYTGLELLDLDAQTLIDNALATLQTTFPDWAPREGNTELVLLEQLAQMVEEDVYAINQLPNSVTEAVLRLFALTRDQGSPPTADVTFTLTDTAGHTIPAGTTVRLNLGDAVDPVDLVTDNDLIIDVGASSGTTSASGGTPTLDANGIAAGTVLELLDSITYVNAVATATAVDGGRVAEDGDSFLDRGVPLLARLTNTLVRPDDVLNYIGQAYPAATRIKVLDLFNPADPTSSPGRSPGYVAVAVAGAGGSSLGAARDTIAADVRNHMHAGLSVTVIDADVTTVDVTLTVLRLASADTAATEAAVVQALTDYLNPDAWSWGGTVYVNELVARADAAAGVDVVLAIDVPSTDLALVGYAPLAKVGTVTVTVLDTPPTETTTPTGPGDGGGTPDPGTPVADALLTGAGAGVLTLFDLTNPASWAKQSAPVNGDTVTDLASGLADTVNVPTGVAPSWAGGGFDYTGITKTEQVVKAPAGALAPIKASAQQSFIVCTYVRLPGSWTLANTSIVPIFCTTDTNDGYSSEADLLTFGFVAPTNQLVARRQRYAYGADPDLTLSAGVVAPHLGRVAQLSYYRNGSGCVFRLRSSAGTTYTSGAVGANNSADFSGKRPRWGYPLTRTNDDTFPNGVTSSRLYRGWIESLDISGRDPVTVLDADYNRNASRFT